MATCCRTTAAAFRWRAASGHSTAADHGGWFADTTLDGVFISRFGNDFLVYDQSRPATPPGRQSFRLQLYWNGNLTFDDQRQYWANFGETGPGIRLRAALMPPSMYFTVDAAARRLSD